MLILILFFIFLVGLLIEKMLHMDYDVEHVIMSLKKDVKRIGTSLFLTEVPRHVFDITLSNDMQGIVKPYSQPWFDIKLQSTFFQNVPVIRVQFVPEHPLSESELQEVSQLLQLKMREYLLFYGLDWKTYITYTIGKDYVNILLFYAELDSDIVPFANLYRNMIRKNSGISGEILRDKELEEELKHVR